MEKVFPFSKKQFINFMVQNFFMTEGQYLEDLSRKLDEQTKNHTPAESLKIFVRLGIYDEQGNVVNGREALVWHLDRAASRQ
jgi:hypothetical protein